MIKPRNKTALRDLLVNVKTHAYVRGEVEFCEAIDEVRIQFFPNREEKKEIEKLQNKIKGMHDEMNRLVANQKQKEFDNPNKYN